MATQLYFTRHGQTVWNVENKICGVTDSPLTQLGRRQATELGEKIRLEKLPIDRILCSPLSRAADTARCIADVTGLPLTVEPRLTEQNFGRFEGTPRNGAEFSAAKAMFVESFDGGESMFRVAARIYSLLDELRGRDETCLLVAHNGIARVVNSYFYDMTNAEYAAFGIQNCEIRRYTFR